VLGTQVKLVVAAAASCCLRRAPACGCCQSGRRQAAWRCWAVGGVGSTHNSGCTCVI